jgi:hypothetical protein
MKRTIVAAAVVLLIPTISSGQFTVFDASNFAKATITANQLMRLSERLAGLDRYRSPQPLPPPVVMPRTVEDIIRYTVTPTLRQLMSAHHLRTVNMAEDIIIRTRGAIDNARRLDDSLGHGISDLERTITTASTTRSLTAVADSIAASSVMNQRQAQTNGVLLQSLVEFQAIQVERARDEAIASMQWQAIQAAPREYVDPPSWSWRAP